MYNLKKQRLMTGYVLSFDDVLNRTKVRTPQNKYDTSIDLYNDTDIP